MAEPERMADDIELVAESANLAERRAPIVSNADANSAPIPPSVQFWTDNASTTCGFCRVLIFNREFGKENCFAKERS